MQSTRFHAKLIVQSAPCTACVIINSLNIETLDKLSETRKDFSWELIEIKTLSQALCLDFEKISGLEVEKLPAVLINDEQISAGTIITPKQINQILELMEDE